MEPINGSNKIIGLFDRYALITLHNVTRAKESRKAENLFITATEPARLSWVDMRAVNYPDPFVTSPQLTNEEGWFIDFENPANNKRKFDVKLIIPIIKEENRQRELQKALSNMAAAGRHNCLYFISIDETGELTYHQYIGGEWQIKGVKNYKLTVEGEYEFVRK